MMVTPLPNRVMAFLTMAGVSKPVGTAIRSHHILPIQVMEGVVAQIHLFGGQAVLLPLPHPMSNMSLSTAIKLLRITAIKLPF